MHNYTVYTCKDVSHECLMSVLSFVICLVQFILCVYQNTWNTICERGGVSSDESLIYNIIVYQCWFFYYSITLCSHIMKYFILPRFTCLPACVEVLCGHYSKQKLLVT